MCNVYAQHVLFLPPEKVLYGRVAGLSTFLRLSRFHIGLSGCMYLSCLPGRTRYRGTALLCRHRVSSGRSGVILRCPAGRFGCWIRDCGPPPSVPLLSPPVRLCGCALCPWDVPAHSSRVLRSDGGARGNIGGAVAGGASWLSWRGIALSELSLSDGLYPYAPSVL